MKHLLKKFTLRLAGLTVLLGLLTFGLTRIFPSVGVTPVYLFILGFLFAFSWMAFYATAKSMQKNLNRFANTYMIVNFLKLVVFSLVLLAYAYLNKEDAAPFMVSFFIYYIFYTVLEVAGLKTFSDEMKNLEKKKKQQL